MWAALLGAVVGGIGAFLAARYQTRRVLDHDTSQTRVALEQQAKQVREALEHQATQARVASEQERKLAREAAADERKAARESISQRVAIELLAVLAKALTALCH
jgi:hypothetical protein